MENKTGQINFTDSFVSRWNHFERSIATFVQKLTKTTRANHGPMQEFKSTAILPYIKSPHVRESGIRNPTYFCLCNPESRPLESGIQSLESGI